MLQKLIYIIFVGNIAAQDILSNISDLDLFLLPPPHVSETL